MNQTPLTDPQMDAIVDSMPGGLAGAYKTWGYKDLIRAVEKFHKILPPTVDDDLRCNVFVVGDKVRVIGNMIGPFVDVAAFRTGVAFPVTNVKDGWLYTVNGMTYMHEALERAE